MYKMGFFRTFLKRKLGTRHIIVLCALSSYLVVFMYLAFTNDIVLLLKTKKSFESFPSNTTVRPEHLKLDQTKKILIWNSYWNSKAVWNKIFSQILHKQCPESRCQLTTDRSLLNSSDAVLFHLVDLSRENYTFPATRQPSQIWIAMTYEPPYILESFGLELKQLDGLFNRTMSYRLDGDVVVRYGTFHKLQHPSNVSKFVSNWIDSMDSIDTRNYAERKTRLIAWFVSSHQCKSQSGREIYVKELENYIPVDIYGSCGPYKCGRRRTMRYPFKVEEDDCYMMISVEYKFVLAFENSFCRDYVTEKLYNNLRLNTVPIVFGAGNYSPLTPPHSVIDANQYRPKELADYLYRLSKNDTEYNEYFRWKQDYVVESVNMDPNPCQLCEQIHNPLWRKQTKIYKKFDEWIFDGCEVGYGSV